MYGAVDEQKEDRTAVAQHYTIKGESAGKLHGCATIVDLSFECNQARSTASLGVYVGSVTLFSKSIVFDRISSLIATSSSD